MLVVERVRIIIIELFINILNYLLIIINCIKSKHLEWFGYLNGIENDTRIKNKQINGNQGHQEP